MAPKKQARPSTKREQEEDSGSEDIVSGPSDEDNYEDDDEKDGEQKTKREAAAGTNDDDGDEGSDFSELQVDFEFFDLAEIDFHGIRALLNRYLDGEQWDLSGMSDALIAQGSSVGTAVKANGDVDPVGVCSVLTLDKAHRVPSVDQVITFVQHKCPEDIRDKLEKAVAAEGTGLLVSERLINTPPELGPPLISGLFEEVSEVGEPWWWESEKRASDGLLASLRFKRYLVLTRVYRDDNTAAEGADGAAADLAEPKSKGKGKAQGAKGTERKLVYPKPEDKALHQHSAWSYMWPAAVPEATAASDAQSKLTQMRLVMLVDGKDAAAVVATTQGIVDALSAEDDGFFVPEEDEGAAAAPPAKKAKTTGASGATGVSAEEPKKKRGGGAVMMAVRDAGGKAAAKKAVPAAGGGGSSASGEKRPPQKRPNKK